MRRPKQPTMTLAEYQLLLRVHLASFVERSFTELNPHAHLVWGWYIDLVCSKLEDCRSGKIKRLIINLPPRSLKSHMASVAFVAWLLGQDPATQIICASYAQDLADKHARDCRQLMASSFYRRIFPDTILADKQSVHEFMTSKKGVRLSTSVGGVLTGRGADWIILDDVMKPEEARSETRRKAVNIWYHNALLSRLNNKSTGVIILVMQRLHEDDLVGHVLEENDNWEVLRLPAIAEEDESYAYSTPFGAGVFTRAAGEVLHPERDPITTLHAIRAEMGEADFESQYQQSPQPLEGGIIKRAWIQYCERQDLPVQFTYKIQSWDTAQKSDEMHDFSVCTTWGVYDGKYYLLDVFRQRLDYPSLKRAVFAQSRLHSPTNILIEDKSSGISLLQELKTLGVYGIVPYKAPPGSDKILRLYAQSTKFEGGLVFILAGAPWVVDYVRELTGCPGGRYDDQVDSTTQALDYLAPKLAKGAMWAKLGVD